MIHTSNHIIHFAYYLLKFNVVYIANKDNTTTRGIARAWVKNTYIV